MQYEDLKDVLSVKDIEEFLCIGRGQAYELVNSGVFHTVRVGSRILIPKGSFLLWFEGKSNL
ncbi:helix-turn-helix domain-containing protein [Fredinandcohnia sp. QZ13]|uniref:helix-turn-helix domain-containing protein n=1 Tax=Fredinandcohnia sp. QZ13 TaxID=3073144 RepID=UPI0028532A7A|nr:helix-turn-helix domain-containing protein [Fredinandcohnia sp. QZ13]MDR4886321.1 helix-turn-helix domain-containing protein [Fredinandcohnia sp. QZ13]